MPRPPRFDLPGCPTHVTQRGVNRCAIFLDDDDRRYYLRVLRDACHHCSVAVHAYVLMDNHVHLLLGTIRAGDLSRAMHRVGHSYVQSFNARHGRSGTLWQGRFKASIVETDDYLFAVMRYIELNPVRAAMVARPEDHPWSSVHVHLGCRGDGVVSIHERYAALGRTPAERQGAWRKWLASGIDAVELASIRRHLQRESALGNPRFQQMVERTLNRPVACLPRGRPRKRCSAQVPD